MKPVFVAYLWVSFSRSTRTVYTHWGSSVCNVKETTLYSGFVGGSHYTLPGAGGNYLCMTPQPVAKEIKKHTYVATVYGTEYEVSPLPQQNFDAVCAVCFVKSRATLMVPGTNVCPTKWRAEYKGILMSGYNAHAGSTEFICVDYKMEGRIGSDANLGGRLLYYATAACGSLPCPPYLNNMILQCVVCSKYGNGTGA